MVRYGKGQGARARTGSKERQGHSSTVSSSKSNVSAHTEVLAPFKMPTALSKTQSPLKDEVFMGENIFTSDFAAGGGERHSYGVKFTINCLSFDDLLDHEYTAIVGEDRKAQASLPQCLFDYYCYTALWRRMLAVAMCNDVLDEKLLSDLERLEEFGDFYLPDPVVKYIQGIGNFTAANGVLFRFDVPVPDQLLSAGKLSGIRGHLGTNLADSSAIVKYLVWPMPYVYCRRIQKTISANAGSNFSATWTLDNGIEPSAPSGTQGRATFVGGLCGFKPLQQVSSSVISQVVNLGWTGDGAPQSLRDSILNIDNRLLELVGSRMAATSKLSMTKYSVSANANPLGSRSQMVRLTLEDCGFSQYDVDRPTIIKKVSTFCREQLSPSQWRAGHLFGYQLELGADYQPVPNDKKAFAGCGWAWVQKGTNTHVCHNNTYMHFQNHCCKFGDSIRSRTFVIDPTWKDDSLSNITQARISRT